MVSFGDLQADVFSFFSHSARITHINLPSCGVAFEMQKVLKNAPSQTFQQQKLEPLIGPLF